MSNKFVTFDQFKAEIKSLKHDIQDLVNQHNSIVRGNWDELDEVKENLNVVKEAVNINSDGCQELEARVNALSERVEKLQKAARGLRVDVDAKTSNGAGVALLVGLGGILAFCWIMAEIDKLSKRIEVFEETRKRVEAQKKEAEPFCSEGNVEDGVSTYVSGTGTDGKEA